MPFRQAERYLYLTTPLGEDALLLHGFTGKEASRKRSEKRNHQRTHGADDRRFSQASIVASVTSDRCASWCCWRYSRVKPTLMVT